MVEVPSLLAHFFGRGAGMGGAKSRSRGSRGSRGHGPRARRKSRVLLTGTMHVSRSGSATVDTPEGRFRVAKRGVRGAMSGDTVQVSLSSPRGRERLAWVQGVLDRATQSFLGSYDFIDPLGVVVPLDSRIRQDFFVLPGDGSAKACGVHPGDVVVARILEYPARTTSGIVTIERRVTAERGLDLPIETVIASYGLRCEFSKTVLASAADIVPGVEEALTAGPPRADFRERCVLTIDPADARDFDDAVGARRVEHGFEVEVHIADVSHYLGWDSPIDREARQRTCSTYLVDRVIPMLPERLCADVCSLRPDEDRLAMSVVMRLGERGELVSARMARSAIRSKARLSYDQVDAWLKGALGAHELPCTPGWNAQVSKTLDILDKLAVRRRRLRHERGSIDFDTKEAKVILDEQGRPIDIAVRRRTRATSLIEEAMLLANECVAQRLSDAGIETAYRVHERPSSDELRAALCILGELGLVTGALAKELVAGSPAAIQEVLEEAAGTPAELFVNVVLLRAQRRAVYLPHNDGHYALGARAYCHFTSPIRRYADLLVHRALKAQLDGTTGSREQREIGRILAQLCRSCSERERVSDAAARDSQRIKIAEFFSTRVGECFGGVVVGCERYGLFVMLDESCAEGLLATRELGDERFSYDDARMALMGEESGRIWRVGMRVTVVVANTSPARGQIDFALPDK